MKTERLGRTYLMVSEVGFGGIPIQRSLTTRRRGLRHCLDQGVNYHDTAYGYGTSEERIGRAIVGRLEGLVLASKAPARDAPLLENNSTELQAPRVDLSSCTSSTSRHPRGHDQVRVRRRHGGGPRSPGGRPHRPLRRTSHAMEIAWSWGHGPIRHLMFRTIHTTEPRENLIPCRATMWPLSP
jgi:diketogulonate reductase-like aldo/keto reductase